MRDVVIRAENLSKRYRIGVERKRHDTLRDHLAEGVKALFSRVRRSAESTAPVVWSLRDVCFEVSRGDVLGIIGRNGAGKSTLLKILSRITEPTYGEAEIYGRVGSLLEVGTGFHGELTGRENVYLNGAILGMKKAEIRSKFDEIVAFAELDRFIDTPVKRYSSGMYMRLAFAVAAHLEPEILIVDEVLAVGDMAFQKKCTGKLSDVAKAGRTVFFVSHNMAAIESLCKRGFLLEKGRLVREGEPRDVINYYLRAILPSMTEETLLSEGIERSGNGTVRLTGFHMEDQDGRTLNAVRNGMNFAFVFHFSCRDGENPNGVDIGFSLHTANDVTLFGLYRSYTAAAFDQIPRKGQFRCFVSDFPVTPGHYRVHARITVRGEEADWPRNGVGFVDVEPGDFYRTGSIGFTDGPSLFMLKGDWEVEDT
jgi:lipopolysaccharide transport system ATP-binding protein